MKKSSLKIVFGYPPLDPTKGIPLLGQNRQFQWAADPWNAYPIVPAYATTLLKKAGFTVAWLDGIAANLTYSEWETKLQKINPNILFIETKTPVVKLHWQIINALKKKNISLPLKTGNWWFWIFLQQSIF